MSRQRAPTEAPEERSVQQENELQALASIFADDFVDLRDKDPWKVTAAGRRERNATRSYPGPPFASSSAVFSG